VPRPSRHRVSGLGLAPPALDRDFPQFSRPLEEKGQFETGTISGCPYSIVALRDLLRHVFTALIHATLRSRRLQRQKRPQADGNFRFMLSFARS
jgi:hypothetical protein